MVKTLYAEGFSVKQKHVFNIKLRNLFEEDSVSYLSLEFRNKIKSGIDDLESSFVFENGNLGRKYFFVNIFFNESQHKTIEIIGEYQFNWLTCDVAFAIRIFRQKLYRGIFDYLVTDNYVTKVEFVLEFLLL